MSELPVTLKPTEAVTMYNLVLLGLIAGIGVFVLSEKIKDKSAVPVKDLTVWGMLVPAAVTVASVYYISKSAK